MAELSFELALKKMAERWPDLFWWYAKETTPIGVGSWFYWGEVDGQKHKAQNNRIWGDGKDIDDLTQDDFDEILALIGWWIEVGRLCAYMKGTPDDPPEMDFKDMKKWAYYGQSEGGGTINSYYEFPTKLSAAKAALIAITQEKSK